MCGLEGISHMPGSVLLSSLDSGCGWQYVTLGQAGYTFGSVQTISSSLLGLRVISFRALAWIMTAKSSINLITLPSQVETFLLKNENVVYFLKAITVEPKKQPLLVYGSVVVEVEV
jgi:hypothetical protein